MSEHSQKPDQPCTDSIVEKNVAFLRSRSDTGLRKYGTTLDRKDLDFKAWAQHLREELADALNYVTRLQEEHEAVVARLQGELAEYLAIEVTSNSRIWQSLQDDRLSYEPDDQETQQVAERLVGMGYWERDPSTKGQYRPIVRPAT